MSMLSEDKDARQFSVEELCAWLRARLDEEDYKDAEIAIRKHRIKGSNFFEFTLEEWVKVVGLPAGIAKNLVEINDDQRARKKFKGIDALISSALNSPKSADEKTMEFLYMRPTDEYYRLFEDDYLTLPEGHDTIKKSIYILTAPSGSGKTKFIFDLALYKGFRVIYMDWSIMEPVIQYVKGVYLRSYQENNPSFKFTDDDNEIRQTVHKFDNCMSQGISAFLEFFKWIFYIADCLHSFSSDDFLKFWVERIPKVSDEIVSFLSENFSAPASNNRYIIAFDECQILLTYLNFGEVYTFEEKSEDGLLHRRGSLYTIFSRVCEMLSVSSKVVIGGTSIKLSLMSKHASIVRKSLHYTIKPPMFTQNVSAAFLIRFGIPIDLAHESKQFLVGRPISSVLYIISWRNFVKSDFVNLGFSHLAIRSMLVNAAIEKMADIFKRKDEGDSSAFMSRVVPSEKSLSLRNILSDLCSNGYINTLSLHEGNTVVEEICTLFLPMIPIRSKNRWEYQQNDPIAFQALIRYMYDQGEDLFWARMSAERLYSMILEQRSVTGEIGEFIMESFLMSLSQSRVLIADVSAFSALKDTDYGTCHFELNRVKRDGDSFFNVMDTCDFGTLCMNVDKMARFDFFCLARHPTEEFVLAVFGGCKLYSRNVSKEIFCDNILSTDPNRSYTNAGGKILNQDKKKKFDVVWSNFIRRHKIKVLQLVFTYPQPVGTVEYPSERTFHYSPDQLCVFIGHNEIENFTFGKLNVGQLAKFSSGWEFQERQGASKKLRETLDEFLEKNKKR